MDTIAQVTDMLEYLFLKQLIKGLRDGTITPDQARQYANDFLPIEPFASLDDARIKVESFVASHQHFEPLKSYIDAYQTDQQTNAKIEAMRKHLQNNNIDEAINVAKG